MPRSIGPASGLRQAGELTVRALVATQRAQAARTALRAIYEPECDVLVACGIQSRAAHTAAGFCGCVLAGLGLRNTGAFARRISPLVQLQPLGYREHNAWKIKSDRMVAAAQGRRSWLK